MDAAEPDVAAADVLAVARKSQLNVRTLNRHGQDTRTLS